MADQTPLSHDSASPDLGDRETGSYPDLNSTLQSRNPFRRQMSSANANTLYHSAPTHEVDIGLDGAGDTRTNEGLGIIRGFGKTKHSPISGLQSDQSDSPRILISPSSPTSGIPRAKLCRKDSKHNGKSVAWERLEDTDSVQSSPYVPYTPSSDQELLSPSRSRHDPYPGLPPFECQTDGAIIGERWTWLSTTILVLAVYSTAFSAIYLVIALVKPRYGVRIGTDGHMSVATASLLSTTFAKTIELSFVTVFVAFLGQALSRRAFLAKARGGGISIADMMMRTWIMQPGTLITHGAALRYAALSFLGVVALTAAFVAMFYVTAADALVAPKLRFGPFEDRVAYGKVAAIFANATFLGETCPTPVRKEDDQDHRGGTCLQIEHAGQAYHNYQLYLDGWARDVNGGNASGLDYASRPPPIGVMFDNTTVRGQWITPSQENITADSRARLVQNVTMAMPHANVFNAARDSANGIMQPQDLNQGEGEYIIKASVPAPAVNILCVGVTEDDIESLIYVRWPTNNHTFNVSTWPAVDDMIRAPAYPNATAVDDLFGFGPEAGGARQRAPIFPKLPEPYNTLVNGTGSPWPANAVYILAGSPPYLVTSPYVLCSLRAMQYPSCTTKYRAARAGGSLTVHCDADPENDMPYKISHPEAPSGGLWDANWRDVAFEWAVSLSLGTGISDGRASNTRLLTQMIPEFDNKSRSASLSPSLPSIGEALGVLSGCNLLLSSLWAPFVHYDNYSTTSNPPEQRQVGAFNASVAYRDYASGGTQPWQGIFYFVLVAVFLTNCFCLVYLIWTIRGEGQVTDYTEPQNLFALAINSPPSRSLSGACGAGPEGDMLGKKWEVDMQKPAGGAAGHPHFYVKCPDDDDHHRLESFKRLRQRKSRLSLRSTDDFEVAESPAVEQYTMLANRRKTLL